MASFIVRQCSFDIVHISKSLIIMLLVVIYSIGFEKMKDSNQYIKRKKASLFRKLQNTSL